MRLTIAENGWGIHPEAGPQVKIRNEDDAIAQAKGVLGESDTEAFVAIFMASNSAHISTDVLSMGSLNAAHIAPSQVFRTALKLGAASVILAHNHPSGETEPSACDNELTKAMVRSGEMLGIKVLDHIVIGKGRTFSFHGHGLIDQYKIGATL